MNPLARGIKGEEGRGEDRGQNGVRCVKGRGRQTYCCGAPTTRSSNVFVPQKRDKRATSPSLSCVNVRVRAKYQQKILGSVTPTPTAENPAAFTLTVV